MKDPIELMDAEELRAEIKRLRQRNHEIADESNRKLSSYQAGFDWIRTVDDRTDMYVRRNEFEMAGICITCHLEHLKWKLEKKC